MAEYRLSRQNLIKSGSSERFIILAILFIFLSAAAAGIASVLINPDWSTLWRGLFLGLLLGWGLAMLNQAGWMSGLLIVITGTLYTLVFGGGLEQKIYSILNQYITGFSRYAFFPEDFQAGVISLENNFLELVKGVIALSERAGDWIWALVVGRAVYDPIATSLVWGVILWVVAAWAGWVVIRYRDPLLAVLPGVTLSVGTLAYSQSVSFTLYLLLGLMLLLMAFVYYEKQEHKWEESGIAYPSRKRLQVNSVAFLLSIGLVILASILSSISLPRILEWVSSIRENAPGQEYNLGSPLGILTKVTPTPDPFEDTRSPGLPREMLIGSGPELSKNPVMTVEIEVFPQVLSGEVLSPIYWRSHTYDVYTGYGWRTSKTTLDEHSPNQVLQPEGGTDYIPINQTVRSAGGEIRSLYTAGIPISVNQTSTTAWRAHGDLFGVQIYPTKTYVAHSQLQKLDAENMRRTGQQYPEWVREHYLSIPKDVPDRVKKLALQLTAAEATPYDRTRAVENYLRSIPYSLDVPHPPPGQDLVDYFLFDLRLGYCDYYASAMVILLRSAGVPARIATGYASGTYNLNTKRFMVSEADAHTWVEVYFPGIGWVPFEPTGSRPTWEGSQTDLNSFNPDQHPYDAGPVQHDQKSTNWFWFSIIGVLGLIIVSTLVFILYDEVHLYYLPETAIATEVYNRMQRYSRYLGVPEILGETPYEFAFVMTSYLLQSTRRSEVPEIRMTCTRYIKTIIDRIVKVSYDPDPSHINDSPDLYHQWNNLRWLLRAVWLQVKVDTWRDRLSRLFSPGVRHIITRED